MEPSRGYSSSHVRMYGKGYVSSDSGTAARLRKEQKRPDALRCAEPASPREDTETVYSGFFDSAGKYSTLLTAAPLLAHALIRSGFPG